MERSKRNSLIEIFRFVFAFFIIFYHELFIVEIPLFSRANYVVDFFFIITGMYMTKILAKYDDLPTLKGCYRLLIDRFIKIGIPLLICYAASIACNAVSKDNNMKVHFLWFIHIMFIAYLVFFILWRIFKKKKENFYFTVFVIALFCFILRYGSMVKTSIPFLDNFLEESYGYDEVRGMLCIPLGMLIAIIPEIRFKNDTQKRLISWSIFAVATALIIKGLYYSSLSLTNKKIVEIISDLILFPTIVYFAQFISFSNKVLNVLGESSLYLYIYQSLGALQRSFGIKSGAVFFSTIVIATVVTMIWKYERRKRRKSLDENLPNVKKEVV